jgi:arsenate reductase (glutaredoxin)
MNITIYHNPGCGTSRNTLAAIRGAGHEPVIIEYLKTPPTRDELKALIARMGVPVRSVVRSKEPLFRELGLDELNVGDEELLDAMMAHPVLINRPIVVTENAVRLCRPSETVKELLGEGEQIP